MGHQLPLELGFPDHQRFESFHAGENAAAIEALSRCAAPGIFLFGPGGAGKTHLLIASCQQLGERGPVQYLPLLQLKENLDEALMGIQPQGALRVDDVDAVAGHRGAEIALFDLFNRAHDQGVHVAFAARRSPNQLPLVLPDLASRLASCAQFALKPLQEDQRKEVLRQYAHGRGFELSEEMLEFLLRRNSRDLGALLRLLDRIDEESLAQQRKITVPFLRRVMGLPSRKHPPGGQA